MAEYDGLSPGQILADASVAEFIKSLGLGIAEAQKALDENSVNQIAEFIEPREGLGGKTLLDLGLSPAFYHYQHADITCSLQLSLKVQKNLGLGLNLNGSFSDNSDSSSDNSQSSSSSQSGSSTRTSTRTANVQITSASAGALTVGGSNFQLNGSTPAERIQNLQDALTSDSNTNIDRVLYQIQASPLTITTDATASEVHTTSNTVAFLGGGFDFGVIRVGQTVGTDYRLDDTPSTIRANTTAQATLEAQALQVRDKVIEKGYLSTAYGPDTSINTTLFDTGKHTIRSDQEASLRRMARIIQGMNVDVTVEGFADTQMYDPADQSDTLNVQLGTNRANEVKKYLVANGVTPGKITVTQSRGVQAARDAGDPEGRDNQDFRKVDIKSVGRTHWWVEVQAQSGGSNLENVTPNKVGDGGNTNGFIYLADPSPLNLTGKKCTIDSIDFAFRGAAVSGFAENAPEAYAKNLADDINDNVAAQFKGSASGNVTSVARDGDPYQLTLVTRSNRNISLSSSEGITVTEQFSRSQSASQTQRNSGNKSVAFGASLDARYSRQFEMNVTGNSSISARLVSIPAPPEFLDTVKSFLSNEGDN